MAATHAAPPALLNAQLRALDRRFEAIMFDWDGTAVADRSSDVADLRDAVESASRWGLHLVVVTGTHVANVDDQLRARPNGPGTLHMLVNRGSEAYGIDGRGPRLLERRGVRGAELDALLAAAEGTIAVLGQRGFRDAVLVRRPDRVKVDLLPEPAWVDPPKARIAELLRTVDGRLRRSGIGGLAEAVELARSAAAAAGLADARVTTDAKHLELGVTDKSDSARWAIKCLWQLGIPPSGVLIAGDEFGPLGGAPGSDLLMLLGQSRAARAVSVGVEPGGAPLGVIDAGGGPSSFLRILRDQIARRARGELPAVDDDERWTLVVEGAAPGSERANESLLTQADGCIGTRGSVASAPPHANPGVFVAGVYRGHGPLSELLTAPRWNAITQRLAPRPRVRRALDLHTGLLHQRIAHGPEAVDAVQFSSVARPGTVALRAAATEATSWGGPLSGPEVTMAGGGRAHARVAGDPGGVSVAASQHVSRDGAEERLERIGVYRSHPRRRPALGTAGTALAAAERDGWERLLNEHRAAMAQRWEECGVAIAGDPELDRAVRFSVFHLMTSVAAGREAAVGARGLTGPAYRGHVFWDADVFVLPFLAATRPRAARAMLEYRLRRLSAARAEAASEGRAGAHLPWESAATGEEVTPRRGRDRLGRFTAIRTGQLEEHIQADVAWAADCYARWSGDERFVAGRGRDLIIETARWWAERIELDTDGRAHIRGVIGPDEYHGPVDDNAFTNVMARWHLRRAAQLAESPSDPSVREDERSRWHRLADALVDGYDASSGIYEQFSGFHALEPVIIADLAPRRPVAASLLLGERRLAGAQVVKQADALMLHHLVPEETEAGSLGPNLDFYEPRTAHGSSLSPGVHAALLARAGRPDAARDLLALTASIDLDDITETTAGGLHLAAMGSVWQALAWGFAGLRAEGAILRLAPHLPQTWTGLELRIRFRGARVRLELGHDELVIDTDRRLRIRLGEADSMLLSKGRHLIRTPDTGRAR